MGPDYACTRCGHDQQAHNNIEGCPHCRCMATQGEAQSEKHFPGTPRPYLGRILGPGAYLHEWQRPEPDCARCGHSHRDHQGIAGCDRCRCVLRPGQYLYEWQRPEPSVGPSVEREPDLLHDPDGSPYPEEVQALYRHLAEGQTGDEWYERVGDMLRDALESVAKHPVNQPEPEKHQTPPPGTWCQLLGNDLVRHYRCDEWEDGTVTNVRTGKVVDL